MWDVGETLGRNLVLEIKFEMPVEERSQLKRVHVCFLHPHMQKFPMLSAQHHARASLSH